MLAERALWTRAKSKVRQRLREKRALKEGRAKIKVEPDRGNVWEMQLTIAETQGDGGNQCFIPQNRRDWLPR